MLAKVVKNLRIATALSEKVLDLCEFSRKVGVVDMNTWIFCNIAGKA